MSAAQLNAALDLMRRLPPKTVEENLSDLLDLAPDLTEDLLSSVDQPLQVALDKSTGREYLQCDYNRDGDSFRSPWSNKYEPEIEEAYYPSDDLREMEVAANEAFDSYREQYYEGGISSVYFWELDEDGAFAMCILIKKSTTDAAKSLKKGLWDAIHVLEVREQEGSVGKPSGKAEYKLTTTIMLSFDTNNEECGNMNTSGNLTRQEAKVMDFSAQRSHLVNIGSFVEDMENRLRELVRRVYFGKTVEVLEKVRSRESLVAEREKNDAKKSLAADLTKRMK